VHRKHDFDPVRRPPNEAITQNQWQIYSFLLSFAVIARQWISHHRLFEQIKAYSPPLMAVNLCWLLTSRQEPPDAISDRRRIHSIGTRWHWRNRTRLAAGGSGHPVTRTPRRDSPPRAAWRSVFPCFVAQILSPGRNRE
jgi:hypothetical protein